MIKKEIKKHVEERIYTLEEYAKTYASTYARANNIPLRKAKRDLVDFMQTYLSIPKCNREVPSSFCSGVYYTKLGNNRFIERCDINEMAKFGRQLIEA